MLQNVTFTDAQGTTWQEATIRVFECVENITNNQYVNNRFALDLNNPQAPMTEDLSDNQTFSREIRFQLAFWTSHANYEANGGWYLLSKFDNQSYITGNGDTVQQQVLTYDWRISNEELQKPEYQDMTSTEEICEYYFTNVILPTLV